MDDHLPALIAIGAYFLVMILIGLHASRQESHEGFVIGSRNVGYIPTIGSLSSSLRDGMGVIFWFGFGASVAYGGLWLFLGTFLGYFLYVFVGSRVRQIAKTHDYITIGEIIRRQLGSITERLTALISICFSLMMIATQLYVSGVLLAEAANLEPWIGIFSVAAIVGLYLYFGGYNTVIKTDAIQFFLILSLLIIPFFFRPPVGDILNFKSLFALDTKTIIAFTGMGFVYILSSADVWQRVFSARDDKVIKLSFPVAGIFLVIMTLSLIFLGMASKPFLGDTIDTSTAFYQIFQGGFIPSYLLAFIAVVVMAICMSTLDTLCYLVTATLAKNFLPPHITKTRNSYVRFSQITMLTILVAMSILALTISDVIIFVFSAASLLFVLAPIYLLTAFGFPKEKKQKTDILITLSIAISCVLYIYMFSQNYFEDALMTLVPVGTSTILCLFTLFITSKK